jgi:hypothetical protein
MLTFCASLCSDGPLPVARVFSSSSIKNQIEICRVLSMKSVYSSVHVVSPRKSLTVKDLPVRDFDAPSKHCSTKKAPGCKIDAKDSISVRAQALVFRSFRFKVECLRVREDHVLVNL